MATVKQLAQDMADAFEGTTRPNGDEIRVLRDGSPDWMRDVARRSHGDMLPDDWRYDKLEDAVAAIADAGDDADLDELGAEFADSAVDVYNTNRYAWLASHLSRAGYVDQAREDFGPAENVTDDIGRGQYMEALEIYNDALAALRDLADEDEGAGEPIIIPPIPGVTPWGLDEEGNPE